MMSFADMPAMPAPAEGCEGGAAPSGDGIMHACLVLPGGAMLMAGDAPPGRADEGIKGAMMALQYDTIDQAHSAFHALSQGGQVTMPLGPTFWSKTFGMVTDKLRRQLGGERRADPDALSATPRPRRGEPRR